MKPSEILKKGLERIKTVGWCQGNADTYIPESTRPMCAVNTIGYVGGGYSQWQPTLRLLTDTIPKSYKGPCAPVDFNDQATKRQVIAWFGRAIKLAEQEEARENN